VIFNTASTIGMTTTRFSCVAEFLTTYALSNFRWFTHSFYPHLLSAKWVNFVYVINFCTRLYVNKEYIKLFSLLLQDLVLCTCRTSKLAIISLVRVLWWRHNYYSVMLLCLHLVRMEFYSRTMQKINNGSTSFSVFEKYSHRFPFIDLNC